MHLNINSSFLLSLRMICPIKFSVFYGNGRKELCKDDDYPIKLRLKLKISLNCLSLRAQRWRRDTEVVDNRVIMD